MIAQDKLDVILAALTDAARDRLATTDRTRFADAMRLCQEAQSVMRLASKRVKDFQGNGLVGGYYQGPINGVMDNVVAGDIDGDNVALRAQYQGHGPLDQAGLLREMMMAIAPYFEAQVKQTQAKERADNASLLSALIGIRDALVGSDLPGDPIRNEVIEKQIDDLVKQLEVRHDDVVPTDAVRRHPAGVQGPEGDQGDLREAVPPGDRGDEGPVGAGGEEGLGDDGVALVRACGQLPG